MRVRKFITLEEKNDDKLREMAFLLRKPASHILDDLLSGFVDEKIKMRRLK